MTGGKMNTPIGSRRLAWRSVWIAVALALAVLLIVGGIAGVLLSGRVSSGRLGAPALGESATGTPSQPSGAGTGSGVQATSTATGATGTPTEATARGDTTAQPPAARRPPKAVLDTLRSGQWRLYGARVIAPGTEMKQGGSTDVQGIDVECDALTKSGNGYAHATIRIAYSATGPASGKAGPWTLFGTWVLTLDDSTSASKHYGQGVEGAMRGRSSVRPPARDGSVAAGFSPIGAYRPRANGVIQSGTFSGNAMFEGLLRLPSVAAPPPAKP